MLILATHYEIQAPGIRVLEEELEFHTTLYLRTASFLVLVMYLDFQNSANVLGICVPTNGQAHR
jgi:hypothetical protein